MRAVTLAAVAVLLVGCSTEQLAAVPEPAPVQAPTPKPEPEPKQEPFTYGDDLMLDRLWDRCANDDLDACDLLYWDSPWDSDYERFAEQRQEELNVTMDKQEIADAFGAAFFLDIVWSEMSNSQRDDLCVAYSMLGADVAAEAVADGTDGLFTADDIRPWLIDKCA